MNLVVVILNWNQAAATIRCVEAVAAWTYVAPDIWVVDNASQDGSRDLITKQCPTAHVLASDSNLGFAGGNNLALRQILSRYPPERRDRDVVLLLNNDAVISEDQVQHLLTELETHPRLGLVGPLLDERRGKEKVFTAGGRDIARHLGTRHECSASDLPALIATHRLLDVDYVPGTVALVRAEVFRTVGLFDEDYFFSGEMADLCRRAGDQGYARAICTRACATHEPGGGARSTLYRYYTLRNRFLYIRKFYPARSGIYPSRRALFAYLWSIAGLVMASRSLIQGSPVEARAAWRALCDGLAGRFGNRNELFL
ncbi:MAG: glycosyltransferase family 2 protein [Verrucomicrobia bacterium]|nr:glycosyltransferase family 2 protein [Verrucomicrobiota bacterium]MBU1736096.1 glycosyltransferase family 2 protein [Verrucomicrobiota bacterium]MBU1857060.1 glycosyltransferase family 2 protein [Verrucomicrobiota bacterium]